MMIQCDSLTFLKQLVMTNCVLREQNVILTIIKTQETCLFVLSLAWNSLNES